MVRTLIIYVRIAAVFITDAKTIRCRLIRITIRWKTDLSDAALRVGWYLSKENITVTQSVEDATSGPDHIEYQLTPSTDSAGTLGSNQDSGSVSVNAEGKASFIISKQFKGSIKIIPYDKAGNAGNPITFEKWQRRMRNRSWRLRIHLRKAGIRQHKRFMFMHRI